jgi:hypothetical protein
MGAKIRFNGGASSVDVLVRDFSQTGARLSASGSVTLPHEFDLFIPKKNATFRARVVWRRSDVLGVTFPGALHEEIKPLSAGEAAARERQAFDAELTRLRNRIAQLTEG